MNDCDTVFFASDINHVNIYELAISIFFQSPLSFQKFNLANDMMLED